MDRSFTLDNPFWQFSLKIYAVPGVAQECLMLQDESGVDVNMLLYCGWRGVEADVLSASTIARLNEAVQAWRVEVVGPLRKVRRDLKGMTSPDHAAIKDLRGRVQATEIFAEQVEQAILFGETPSDYLRRDRPAEAIDANLDLYLSGFGKTGAVIPAFKSVLLSIKE